MRRVVWIGGWGKSEVKVGAVVEAMSDLDTKVEMIQALIPLGVEKFKEEALRAVVELAGPWYRRSGGSAPRFSRSNRV